MSAPVGAEAGEKFSAVVDIKTMQPACVLLQAVWGGDRHVVSQYFDSQTWLTFPTKDMRMVSGTRAEWKKIGDHVSNKSRTKRKKR